MGLKFQRLADSGSTLTNCAASANTSSAGTSAGIRTGSGCTISRCAAYNNSSTAASSPTTGMGFSVPFGSTIENCTAFSNEGDGINIADDTLVLINT